MYKTFCWTSNEESLFSGSIWEAATNMFIRAAYAGKLWSNVKQ